MKYGVRQYALTLIEAFKGRSPNQQGAIFKRFLAVLSKNKDWSRLPAILRQFECLYLKKSGLKKVAVESADELSAVVRRDIQEIFGHKAFLSARVNPAILGGVKILVNDEILIDASAKRRMNAMLSNRK